MENLLWIQNKDSGKESIFFLGNRKISGSEKESFKITRFLTETKFETIYESKTGTIKEVAKNSDGYLIAGLLVNEEEDGRRIPFTSYTNGHADDVLDYLNGTLNSNSLSISDEDQVLIKNIIKKNQSRKKAIVLTGIAVVSLIAIYYLYGES